jgi:hypothetical protein
MDNKKDRWWEIISSVLTLFGEAEEVPCSSMESMNAGEGNTSSI